MKQELKQVLFNLEGAEIKELIAALDFANKVAILQKEYNITDKELAELFKIKEVDLEAYKKGIYPYTLEDLATYNHVAEVLYYLSKKELKD